MKPHQVTAFDDVRAELRKADRATLVMACGTGKTRIGTLAAADIVQEKPGLIVALFPSLALIDQTYKVWVQIWPGIAGFKPMIVCSDTSVGNDDDDDTVQVDLATLPCQVTTSQSDIAAFIGKRQGQHTKIIFTTYHSAPLVGGALLGLKRWADFGVFDEAHRTAGSVDSAFGAALHDDRVPIRKRLFMTATPRVVKRLQRNKAGDAPVVSMDDPKLYGRHAHTYSFRQGVKDNIICDYKIIVSHVTKSDLPGGVPNEETAALVALDKGMKKFNAKKVITFHKDVAAAQRFATQAQAVLSGVKVVHVNGRQNAGERVVLMRQFEKSNRGLATNARCLTEGVDVPAVDMIGFMSRKESVVDIVQAVGRALRKPANSGKEVGYILVPLLLDTEDGESLEAAIKRAKRETLWRVMSSMMDEDADLSYNIETRKMDVLINGAEPKSGKETDAEEGEDSGSDTAPSTAGGDGSDESAGGVGPDVTRLPITVISSTYNVDDLRRAIETDLVEHLSDGFDHGLACLMKYYERTGKANPLDRHVEDGFNLGMWCGARRRAEYRAGKLSPDRIARLEAVPGWSWNPIDDLFEQGIGSLISYRQRTGNANPPVKHAEDGFNLGMWCGKRRREYRAGKLSPDRIARLEAVPGWSWHLRDEKFEQGIGSLISYRQRTGKANPLDRHVEDGFNLGVWCATRRVEYRAGKLSPDRIARLEAVPGWSWNPIDDLFEQGIGSLIYYRRRTGKANPLDRHVEDGFNLGMWCSARRAEYRAGKLSPDRIARLEAVPGWSWNPSGHKS